VIAERSALLGRRHARGEPPQLAPRRRGVGGDGWQMLEPATRRWPHDELAPALRQIRAHEPGGRVAHRGSR
jgi:hypothetical protein